MDPHAFDRATRLFRTPQSRRAAWRALLGGAFLGATARRGTAAAPSDTSKAAMCAGAWCPGRCFTNDHPDPACRDELCCLRPEYIICGDRCCRASSADGRTRCTAGACLPPRELCAGDPAGGITGSYRRR